MRITRSTVTGLVIAASLAVAGTAIASSSSHSGQGSKHHTSKCGVSAGPALSLSEIVAKIEAAGYPLIKEIERENGCFEAEARDSTGKQVEMLINASTGEIVRIKDDD